MISETGKGKVERREEAELSAIFKGERAAMMLPTIAKDDDEGDKAKVVSQSVSHSFFQID